MAAILTQSSLLSNSQEHFPPKNFVGKIKRRFFGGEETMLRKAQLTSSNGREENIARFIY